MREEGREIIDELVENLGIKVKNARVLMKAHKITSSKQILDMDEYEIMALDGESKFHELYIDITKSAAIKGLSFAEPKQEYSQREIDRLEFVRLVGFNRNFVWGLEKQGCYTIEDLCNLRETDILRWCSTTQVTVNKLVERMAEKGLELKPEFDNAEFLDSLPISHAIYTQLGKRGIITKEDFSKTSTTELTAIRGINMRGVYELDKTLKGMGVNISTDEHYEAFKQRVEDAQRHIDGIDNESVRETLNEALDSWMRVYPRK